MRAAASDGLFRGAVGTNFDVRPVIESLVLEPFRTRTIADNDVRRRTGRGQIDEDEDGHGDRPRNRRAGR